MAFTFGCAREIYAARSHPRLLIGPEELSVLRQRSKTGWAREIMEALRFKVARLVMLVEQTDDLPALLAHHTVGTDPMGEHVFQGAGDIAMVAALDEDDRATAAAARIFWRRHSSRMNSMALSSFMFSREMGISMVSIFSRQVTMIFVG